MYFDQLSGAERTQKLVEILGFGCFCKVKTWTLTNFYLAQGTLYKQMNKVKGFEVLMFIQ